MDRGQALSFAAAGGEPLRPRRAGTLRRRRPGVRRSGQGGRRGAVLGRGGGGHLQTSCEADEDAEDVEGDEEDARRLRGDGDEAAREDGPVVEHEQLEAHDEAGGHVVEVVGVVVARAEARVAKQRRLRPRRVAVDQPAEELRAQRGEGVHQHEEQARHLHTRRRRR